MSSVIIVSLLLGLVVGLFINYAVDFRSGELRNIGICVVGAIIGAVVVAALFGTHSVWAAIIGGLIGVVAALWIAARSLAKST